MFLAYVAHKKLKVFQMDVKSEFLNEELEEEVYLEQPPRFRLWVHDFITFEYTCYLVFVDYLSLGLLYMSK